MNWQNLVQTVVTYHASAQLPIC